MGIQVVSVVVDVHEPRGITDELNSLRAQAQVERLAVGDYATGEALIERKTVRDLHLTLAAGRLWGQLGGIRAAAPKPFLLVEGPSLDAGPVSPAAIRGALLAASENGVAVVRSESAADSALWIYRIACRSARRARDRPLYAQRPKPATAEAVLAAIPHVSTRTARSLLAHFGTVAEVVQATDDELKDVCGVGPIRAHAIRETFTRQPTSYRSRRSRE